MNANTDAGALGQIDFTEDHLLNGQVTLCQPKDGYRAAIDPVFLAAAISGAPGDHVLDAGAGVGAAALCLANRLKKVRVTGIEINPESVALAQRNIQLNGFVGRLEIVEGDILLPPESFSRGSFDQVMANPPYHAVGRTDPSPDAGKATAHAEKVGVDLNVWVSFALDMVRTQGVVTFIHHADRESELIDALVGRSGNLVVFPLLPKVGARPKRIIVQATKGAAVSTRRVGGLALHDENGAFTLEAEAVLRQGKGLEL